jgi:CRISPR-associated endonuclease/helicase Cas3
MLIQRLGRLWRHSRNNRPSESPECIIISGNIGPAKNKEELINLLGKNNSKVYAPYVLWKTWTVWEKLKSIGIPSDIRNVLESTYLRNKIDEPGFINELYEEMMIEREKLRRKASAMLTGVSLPVADDDDDRATTRYSEIPAIDCLLVKKIFSVKRDEAEITLLSGEKLKVSSFQRNHLVSKLLHKNTFSVASYNFNGNGNSFKIPDYLKKHFYGRLAVLKIDNGTLYLDEEQTILRYTDELGVHKQDSISMESKKIMDYNKYESGEFDYELDNW